METLSHGLIESKITAGKTRTEDEQLHHEHRRVMRAGAQALESGLTESYIALHLDQLVFHVFGSRNEINGDYHGKEALRRLYVEFRRLVGGENYSIHVHDTLCSDAHGVWLIQFFRDREKSYEEHDTMYVICEFYEGLISEAWFVFWPGKMVVSPFLPEGHLPYPTSLRPA